MASHWKLIACDLDGTLIGWNHKINDRDLDALRKATAAGIHIAICTGRNSLESAGVIASLGLKGPGVFVNGAMVCDMATGAALDSQTIDDELVDEIVAFFGARGHAVLALADDPATRLPRYLMTDHGPPHDATTDWLRVNRVHSELVSDLPAACHGRIVRLGVVVDVEQQELLHNELQREFAGHSTTHSIYSPHYDCQIIEAFRFGVNKWSGMEHLAALRGVGSERIVAIGDDINDVAMLRGATLSFAMGNASDRVKAQAKQVTAPQEECGLAQVIEDLLRGKWEPA